MAFSLVTLPTSGMSCESLDFSRNPSRGKLHSVRMGSLSWESTISSRDRKFSPIPTPGCTGRYDCVSIVCPNETESSSFISSICWKYWNCVQRPLLLCLQVFFLLAILAPGPVDQSERCLRSRAEQSIQSESNWVKNICCPCFYDVFPRYIHVAAFKKSYLKAGLNSNTICCIREKRTPLL